MPAGVAVELLVENSSVVSGWSEDILSECTLGKSLTKQKSLSSIINKIKSLTQMKLINNKTGERNETEGNIVSLNLHENNQSWSSIFKKSIISFMFYSRIDE